VVIKQDSAKDAVNILFAVVIKIDNPKATISNNILVPYSDRMKKLHEDPRNTTSPRSDLQDNDIGSGFAKDNALFPPTY